MLIKLRNCDTLKELLIKDHGEFHRNSWSNEGRYSTIEGANKWDFGSHRGTRKLWKEFHSTTSTKGLGNPSFSSILSSSELHFTHWIWLREKSCKLNGCNSWYKGEWTWDNHLHKHPRNCSTKCGTCVNGKATRAETFTACHYTSECSGCHKQIGNVRGKVESYRVCTELWVWQCCRAVLNYRCGDTFEVQIPRVWKVSREHLSKESYNHVLQKND